MAETVIVTLRLSPKDRALLDKLLEQDARELEEHGVEVSLSSVVRRLIRAEAKARGVEVDESALAPRPKRPAPRPPVASQEQVRKLLGKRLGGRRGLGAELARRFGVEPAQVSRWKAGTEPIPAGKLDEVLAFLKEEKTP